jgi:hypothetical protein
MWREVVIGKVIERKPLDAIALIRLRVNGLLAAESWTSNVICR